MAENKNMFDTHPTKVITGKGRLTFAFIWEPRDQEDGKKYSTSFLIPKSDGRTIQNIQNAIQNAIIHGQAKGYWAAKLPPNFKMPLRDGDLEADEKGEEYRGHFFINASSLNAPRIVDTSIQDILNRDEVYSGCYARLSINLYPFNSNGNKGIGCGLNHVQKLFDGEPLGGARSKPEDDFNDWSDGSGDTFDEDPRYAPLPTQQVNAGYPQQAPGGYPPQQQAYAGYPQQAPAGYPPAQQAYAGYPQQNPNSYPQAQQAHASYPQQAPNGYPQAQQASAGYPQQAPSGYPAQQEYNGYPPVQQAPAGYPVQQAPAGYPVQQAPAGYTPAQGPTGNPGSFSDQLAAAASILPPNLFGDELNKVA